mmetsp:Transcript_20291/g.29984  ORF Transcript_20291/g.29984 Transcript_20291/m.29984 type:complete len:167 (+) Transcript_20291:86-586(+)
MVRVSTCYFCSGPVYPGHGVEFARNDSKLFRFCGAKCHKNFRRKRNPRKVRWTKAFRKAAGKEMVVDSTFAFEKRRNRPVKYDRDLVSKTLVAIKKIGNVQEQREKRFFEFRNKEKVANEKASIRADIEKNIELVIPAAADREKAMKEIREKVKSRGTKHEAMDTE